MNEDSDLKNMLRAHIENFDRYTGEWKEHRIQAGVAMKKVDSIEDALKTIAPNVAHLGQLPLIATSISSLKDGLLMHNSGLIAQNTSLMQPATNAQGLIVKLMLIMMLLVGAALFIVLLKGAGLDLSVLGDSGVKITGSRREVRDDGAK